VLGWGVRLFRVPWRGVSSRWSNGGVGSEAWGAFPLGGIISCLQPGGAVSKIIIRRHPLNARFYTTLVRDYADKMKAEGYINDDAPPIHLQAMDDSYTMWYAIGGATRCEAFILAWSEDPTNLKLLAFVKTGGFNAIYYSFNMPDNITLHLVEELNDKNGLGASNTVMQKLLSVPMYQKKYSEYCVTMERKAADGDDLDDKVLTEVEFVRKETSLYGSDVEWKRSMAIHSALAPFTIAGESLLQAANAYFGTYVKILAMQNTEKQRSLIKYIGDMTTKILPQRRTDGKGKGIAYPDLWLAAFKMAFESTDAVPFVQLSDTSMNKLSDTVDRIDCGAEAVPEDNTPVPKKQKGKKGEAVPLESSGRKIGISNLDKIEMSIASAKQKLTQGSIDPISEHINTGRMRLLEAVFRGGVLDVNITSSAGTTTSKQLKGLPAVCNYVEKKIWELHTAGAGFASTFPQDADVAEVEVAEAHEKTGPAFVLPVDQKCMHSLMEKPSKALVIRQSMGTNFTKRLVVGVSLVVKNNKNRLVVNASQVWKAPTLAEALTQFVASSSLTPEQLILSFSLHTDEVWRADHAAATIESVGLMLARQRSIASTAPCIIAELTAADDSSDIADAAEDVVTRGVHLLRYKYCVTSFRLRSVLQHIVE
jgi:hypothetical protein